jgi:hypothetical protein
MKFLITLLVAFSLLSFGKAQCQGKPFVFPQVHVPDSLWNRLVQVANEEEGVKADGVLIRNLESPEDLVYHDGIFTFTLPGPHFHRRLFFVRGSVVIVSRSWTPDDLLREYITFIRQAEPPLRAQVSHIRAIASFVEEELEANIGE